MDIKIRKLLSDSQKHIDDNNYNDALKILLEALQLDNKNPKIYLQMARIYLENNDENKSVELINNALILSQDSIENYVEAAKLVYKMGNIADHNKLVDKALEINKNDFGLNYYLANRLAEVGNLSEALKHAKIAVEQDRNNIAAYETLSVIYEGMADTENVKELIKTVKIKFKKKQLYVEVKILMQQKKYSEAIEFIKKYIKNNKVTQATYARILIDLAHCFDKNGEYNKAYKTIIDGKKQKKESKEGHKNTGNFNDILTTYTEYFSNCDSFEITKNNSKNQAKEPIFIVGFPRSGTTLIEQIIYCAEGLFTIDETPFINRICNGKAYKNQPPGSFMSPVDLIKISKSEPNVNVNRDLYFKLIKNQFGEISDDKRIIDKMPANTILIPVIKTLFPHAKIIVAIRDPRDCLVSCLFQNFAKDTFHNFDEAAEMYDNVMGLYLHYKRVFKDDILEVRYEDILDDFENKARTLYDFIGEEWTDEALKFHKKEREIANKTPNRYAINEPIYKTSLAKWKNYEMHLKPYIPRLEKYLKEFGYEV